MILVMLILIADSTFAQYPIVKKIGNDSVVIMTTSQGRKINELFEQNDKEIIKLKDSVDSLKTKYVFSTKIIDSLKISKDTIKHTRDSLSKLYYDMKFRRDTNIVIYKAAEEAAETKYNKTIRLWQWINIGYFVVMVSIFSLIRADQ